MEKLNGLDTSEDDLTLDEKNEELAKYYDSLAEKDKEEEKIKMHSPEWAYEKVLTGHKVRPERWNVGYVAFDRHFNYIEMLDDLGTVTKFPYRKDINQSQLFDFSDHWEIVAEDTLEKTSALQFNQEEESKSPCRKPTAKKFKFSVEEIKKLLVNAGCNLEGYKLKNYYPNSSDKPHLFINMTFEAVLDD